ncbi:MAG: hypothetical protein M3Z09_02745 [Acidobacteriota bacterium]|nr:hypothetical protein [Acidobacteriota bacterium]
MTSGKQLLHATLVAFLAHPPFLSDEEESCLPKLAAAAILTLAGLNAPRPAW